MLYARAEYLELLGMPFFFFIVGIVGTITYSLGHSPNLCAAEVGLNF